MSVLTEAEVQEQNLKLWTIVNAVRKFPPQVIKHMAEKYNHTRTPLPFTIDNPDDQYPRS